MPALTPSAVLLKNRKLGLLGAGNMAEALARGVLEAGAIEAQALTVSDISPERRALFKDTLGATATDDNSKTLSSFFTVSFC